MEARRFFEGSSMDEVTVSATPGEWDIILDHLFQDKFGLTEDSKGWELVIKLRELGVA